MLAGNRGRTRALLGTASAIALAAGLGLAPLKARAQVQTISVSETFFQVSIDADLGATGFDIVSPAIISANNSTPAFWVDVPITEGVTVSSGGAIDSDTLNEDSIGLLVDADTDGGIENSGTISATALTDSFGEGVEANAVEVSSGVTVTGDIVNNAGGTISAYAGPGEPTADNDWSAHGILLNEGSSLEDGLENAGYIGATAGEIVSLPGDDTIDLDAFARGIAADSTDIEGDVVNLGTVAASATAFGESFSVDFFGGVDTGLLLVDNDAAAIGIDLDDELDGAFVNSGTVTASSLAGADFDRVLLGEGSALLGATLDGSADSYAAGAILNLEENGTPFDGFLNSGMIGADAEARISLSGFASSGENASAFMSNFGELSAEALGASIDIDGGLITGSIVNDATGQIMAEADAESMTFADAQSDDANADALAQSNGLVEAEATGLEVRLDSLLGDVVNNGNVLADAHAHRVGEAEATSGPGGGFGESGAYATADLGGDVEATARGGILIADLILGDVTVGTGGSFVGLADARIDASAYASSAFDEAEADAFAGDGVAEADAIGYYVNVETLGDFVNNGSLVGEATAGSYADATALAGEDYVRARAEAGEAYAEAQGAVVVVDNVGLVSNTSGETVAGYARAESVASASGEGLFGEAIAESEDAYADAVGLWVISPGVIGEGVDNSGAILAAAEASSRASADLDVVGGGAFADAYDAHADAQGLLVEADLVIGDVGNSGTVEAYADAESIANVDLDLGGEGGFGLAETGYVEAHAAGLTVLGDVVTGEVVNSGLIDAEALARNSATLDIVGGSGFIGEVYAGGAEALAEGLTVLTETVVGGIHNDPNGVILAFADASVLGEATGTTLGDGSSSLFVTTIRGGGRADAIGLRAHGESIFHFGESGVLSGLLNEGVIVGVGEASTEARADLSGGLFADVESYGSDASADGAGIAIDSEGVTGDLINSGLAIGESFALLAASATASAELDARAVAFGDYADADADGWDIGVDFLTGNVINSGSLLGDAIAAVDVVSSATTGESGTATAESEALSGFATAKGLDIYADDAFAADVSNGETGLIVADASLQMSSQATASGGLYGEAVAMQDFGSSIADGIDMDVEEGAIVGDVTNSGTIVGQAGLGMFAMASASGEFESDAVAVSQFFDIDADGIDIEGDNAYVGIVRNDGVIISDGDASRALFAMANGQGANSAAAFGGFGEVQANGIELSATVGEGEILNGGTIEVAAAAEQLTGAMANGGAFGEAYAADDAIDVEAVGISLQDVDVMSGRIVNEAGGVLLVSASHSGETLADASGSSEARAFARGPFVGVESWGVSFGEGDLFSGEMLNDGVIQSTANAVQTVEAIASATGESGLAWAQASLEESRSDAEGLNVSNETIVADFANNGSITVSALTDGDLYSVASGGDLARADAFTSVLSADVEGMNINAGEVFEGSVANGETGVVSAIARNDTTVGAEATSLGESWADARSGDATATSDGLDLDGGLFIGDVMNQGSVFGEARVDIAVTATASGESARASADSGFIDSDADGIDFNASDILIGDVLNSGILTGIAASAVDNVATATAGEFGEAAAFAFNGIVTANASAMEVTGEQIDGDLVNSGLLGALGVVERDLSANASGGDFGEADVLVFDLFATGRGLDIDDFTRLMNGNIANGTGGEIFAEAFASGLLDAYASGDLEANAGVFMGEAVAEAVGIEVEIVEMNGDVTNGGFIQALAQNSQAGEALAQSANGSANAEVELNAVVTTAVGIGFIGEEGFGDGTLTGDIINSGTILALANGPHEASASAIGGESANAFAESSGGSGAWGILTYADEVSGDLLNSGVMTVVALESGTVTATAIAGEGGEARALAEGYSEAVAGGLKTILPTQTGDLGNLLGGDIEVGASASVTAVATAQGELTDALSIADARSFAAGIDLHTERTYPGAALGGESGSLLDGQLFNHGSIAVESLSDASAGGTGFGEASALSVAQGIGAVVEAITMGVENSGTIISESNATASIAGELGELGGQAEVRSLAYGILLLGPAAGEGLDSSDVPPPPAPLGTIGDGDEDGIAIENSGVVIAMADGTAVGDGKGAYGSSYAAALQVGRGYDGLILGEFLADDGPGDSGLLVAGDIVNSGTLSAFADGQSGSGEFSGFYESTAVGLGLFGTVVEGQVNNSGTISAATGEGGIFGYAVGILVDGSIVGEAINNTGLIIATTSGEFDNADAINTVEASAGTIINLLDGSAPNDQLDPSLDPNFNGDNPLGVVGDIRLSRVHADTVNWSGGDIQGDIYGNWGEFFGPEQQLVGSPVQDDVLNVFAGASDVFDFDGDIYGLYQINVNTGETLTPVELTLRGYVGETTELNVNDAGTLVIGAANPALVGHGEVWVETYNHAAGGTLLFELTPDPDDVGFIVATADTTLNIEGGTIGIRPRFGGFYADETIYEVIYSENRIGEFDDTYSPTPLLSVAVEYGDYDGAPGEGESDDPSDVNDIPDFDDGDSDVRLRVTRNAFDSLDGLTPNQRAVGGGIENVYGPDLEDTPFGDGISLLFLLDEKQYRDALSTLHGAEHAQLSRLTDYLAGIYHDWLTNRLAEGRSDDQTAGTLSYVWDPQAEQLAGLDGTERNAAAPQLAQAGLQNRAAGSFSIWTNGGAMWGNADGDPSNDVVGFDQDTWGVMLGADYQIDANWLVGIGGVYQDTNVDFEDGDEAEIDGFQIGGFVNYTDASGFYGDGSFSIGWFDYETRRQVVIGPLFSDIAEGETDAFVATGALEIGYMWQAGGFLLQPLAGLEYTHASIDGFAESGADPFNLVVEDRDADSLESRLGFVASTELDLGGMLLIPEVRAEWRHEFLDDREEVTSAFVGQPGSSFTAIGSEFGRDAAVVGAGLTLRVTDSLDAFVDYDGRFQSDYEAHAISGGLRFSW